MTTVYHMHKFPIASRANTLKFPQPGYLNGTCYKYSEYEYCLYIHDTLGDVDVKNLKIQNILFSKGSPPIIQSKYLTMPRKMGIEN